MADVYEFHITGLIGPVSRGALGELTVDSADRESVLTGIAHGPEELDGVLHRLDEFGLVPTEIRICPRHRWHGTDLQASAEAT